jgi:hypothetical protein
MSKSSVIYLWYLKAGPVSARGGAVRQVIVSTPRTGVWCPPEGAAGTLEKLPAPLGSNTDEENFNVWELDPNSL